MRAVFKLSTLGLCAMFAAPLGAQVGAPPRTSTMQAGGLAPPAPVGVGPSTAQPQSGTLAPPGVGTGPLQVPLAQGAAPSSDDDSGRGLDFVIVGVTGGVAYTNLDALGGSGSILPSTLDTSGFGPALGAMAALRLLYLTVGPEFRYTSLPDVSLLSLNLGLGWRVPLGRLEPYGTFGGGYAHASVKDGEWAPGGRGFGGFDLRLGGGVDYFVTEALSVGGYAMFDVMRLSRGASAVAGAAAESPLQTWASHASAWGVSANLGALAALHF